MGALQFRRSAAWQALRGLRSNPLYCLERQRQARFGRALLLPAVAGGAAYPTVCLGVLLVSGGLPPPGMRATPPWWLADGPVLLWLPFALAAVLAAALAAAGTAHSRRSGVWDSMLLTSLTCEEMLAPRLALALGWPAALALGQPIGWLALRAPWGRVVAGVVRDDPDRVAAVASAAAACNWDAVPATLLVAAAASLSGLVASALMGTVSGLRIRGRQGAGAAAASLALLWACVGFVTPLALMRGLGVVGRFSSVLAGDTGDYGWVFWVFTGMLNVAATVVLWRMAARRAWLAGR